jgi:hypothetical protein
MCWTLLILGVCVFVASLFCFWMARWWTLEMTAALFSPYMHLEMMWMRLFHHGNGGLALKQRESILFGDFWHIKMILQLKMPQRPFSKLKKHAPTNLYMLYPMAQSVALFCIEIDKKMPLQWHCPPWSSSIVHHTKPF